MLYSSTIGSLLESDMNGIDDLDLNISINTESYKDVLTDEEIQAVDEAIDNISLIEMDEGEDPSVSMYRSIYENELNFSNIVRSLATAEITCLESTGEEMVYTEANVKEIFKSIGAALDKAWQKIKSVFYRIMSAIANNHKMNKKWIDSLDKNALTKAKEVDLSKYPKDYYSYNKSVVNFASIDSFLAKHEPSLKTAIDVFNNASPSEEEIKTALQYWKDNKVKGFDKVRGAIVGKEEVNAKNFRKAVIDAIAGTPTKCNVKLDSLIKNLTEKPGSNIAKRWKDFDSEYRKDRKELKKDEKNVEKGNEAALALAKSRTEKINAYISITGSLIEAISASEIAKVKQSRSIIIWALNGGKVKEKEVQHNSASLLEDLQLI